MIGSDTTENEAQKSQKWQVCDGDPPGGVARKKSQSVQSRVRSCWQQAFTTQFSQFRMKIEPPTSTLWLQFCANFK